MGTNRNDCFYGKICNVLYVTSLNVTSLYVTSLQNQILNRQLKRMDAENASLKERLDDDDKYENELKGQLKEAERREADLLSKVSDRGGSTVKGKYKHTGDRRLFNSVQSIIECCPYHLSKCCSV